jgi:hypothetical protein
MFTGISSFFVFSGKKSRLLRDYNSGGQPAVKLVAVGATGSRLAQNPEVKGALRILDKPLPPEEWGELTER